LEIHTSEVEQLSVLDTVAVHLHRLQHLITKGAPCLPDASTILRLAESPAAQQLETVQVSLKLPDMECVAKLLAMPKLKELCGALSFPNHHEVLPSQLPVPWPEGKPPMEMVLDTANVRQLAALPLEHFSKIDVTSLYLASDADRQEREQLMRALLAGAAQVPEFWVAYIRSHSWEDPAAGLSALGPNCPIKLRYDWLYLARLDLSASDMQGVAAAWGPGATRLVLSGCVLATGAWVAITPAAFPVLRIVQVKVLFSVEFIVHLTAFCLGWPADRQLSLLLAPVEQEGVEEQGPAAQVTAIKLREVLQARRRPVPCMEPGLVF
jgi:hypothetical protein